jgi:hypothetical protein
MRIIPLSLNRRGIQNVNVLPEPVGEIVKTFFLSSWCKAD